MPFVLDASIAAKWFIDEEHATRSREFMARRGELIAPDLLHVELASTFLKRVRNGTSTFEEFETANRTIRTLVRTMPSQTLVFAALKLAADFGRSVYDSLYVALAIQYRCQLVTADRRLYNALVPGPLAETMFWIGDLPAGSTTAT